MNKNSLALTFLATVWVTVLLFMAYEAYLRLVEASRYNTMRIHLTSPQDEFDGNP